MLPSDKRVLDALRSLGQQTSFCSLARETGYASSTVSRALSRLEERGLVNLHYVHFGATRHLRFIVPVDIVRPGGPLWLRKKTPATTPTLPELLGTWTRGD